MSLEIGRRSIEQMEYFHIPISPYKFAATIENIPIPRGGISVSPRGRGGAMATQGNKKQIVILGAGISGHTAARYLIRCRRKSKTPYEVVVVTPNPKWNWIPSNIWVGVGQMTSEQVTFDLAPLYQRIGVPFHQARGVSIHPEGDAEMPSPYVLIEYTSADKAGQTAKIPYDYLINATGPKLNFGATEGLGPDHGHTVSVCTASHALEANHKLQATIEAMRRGEKKTIVIGTGHGTCTCQGAAFEYIYNVEHVLRDAGVRDKARLVWISNEYELGDFGMGGVHIERGGYITNGKVFAESLMVERGIEWITRAAVNKVEAGKIHYEKLDGSKNELDFDFAMLIPPFSGVGLKAFDKAGEDITAKLFAPSGFMKVDGDTPRPSPPSPISPTTRSPPCRPTRPAPRTSSPRSTPRPPRRRIRRQWRRCRSPRRRGGNRRGRCGRGGARSSRRAGRRPAASG